MTSPPGWHPDPAPQAPGQPVLLRYWDGQRWTEHTTPAAVQPYGHASREVGGRSTTPDGVPLAGWWHRVGASLVDTVILVPVVLLVTFPWVREIIDIYGAYFDEVFADVEAGRTTSPDTTELQDRLAGPTLRIAGIGFVIGFAYHVGFLMWRQATPGKLLTGLRVRLRERPGPMPLGTVVVRWLAQTVAGIVSLVPYVGNLTWIYSLLDVLWPLWDGKRQAIHDKLAKTNVVRVR